LKKWFPFVIVIVLGLGLFFVKRCQRNGDVEPSANTTSRKKKDLAADRDRGFDRRTSFLEYSNHARCRMQCRKITQAEVEAIMQDGKINYTKSDLQNARCPRYAVEGITRDDQRVRIVFAQCNESTTVVTVIDLGNEWSCDCPGDDDKYKNK
jgi:Domain of unknown function (DUF4258)